MDQLKRALREAADANRRSQQSQQQSREMSDAARKLLENATPEQKRELEQLMQDLAKDNPGGLNPGDKSRPITRTPPRPIQDVQTRPVDARTKPDRPAQGERTIAEWFSNRPIDRNAPAGSSPAAEDLQRAAKSAEQAIEQQTIPARYTDLIKRVFKRNSEQAAPQGGGSPPPP